MISSILHIAFSPMVSYPQIRKVIAFVLLFLVSLSFIIEHIPFMEGDVLELVESSEKEAKKTKDKKVVFFSSYSIQLYVSELQSNEFVERGQSNLSSVILDILTPPPRQV